MQEKVVLVGGAENQCHAVNILQEQGYYVIVVDYNTDCLGKELADEFHCISTADVEKITELAESTKAEAVLAVQSDLGLVTAGIVSERLGLKGIPLDKITLFTNKYKMREYLKENGFLYPAFSKCRTVQEIKDFSEKNGFPFIMKPLDSQGSRGVELINTENEFEKISSTMVYSKNESAVIVEEYLGSDEYTVEGIVVNGKHITLAVSQKKHYEKMKCVSKELYYSWKEEYAELIKNHDRLINSTKLPFGITHSEYIKTKKGFTLVEFTARGGGAMISSHIVPIISGWDVEEIYINQVLQNPINLPERKKNCAVLKFIELECGKIKKIEGMKEIQNMENVLHFELLYQEGQCAAPVSNDTNRHGYFIAWAKDTEELDTIIENVEKTLKVEYETE